MSRSECSREGGGPIISGRGQPRGGVATYQMHWTRDSWVSQKRRDPSTSSGQALGHPILIFLRSPQALPNRYFPLDKIVLMN